MIQSYYGSQDTADSIIWPIDEEAVLWVTDSSGATVLMVNLTNLADWRLDGSIANDEDLRADWLKIEVR